MPTHACLGNCTVWMERVTLTLTTCTHSRLSRLTRRLGMPSPAQVRSQGAQSVKGRAGLWRPCSHRHGPCTLLFCRPTPSLHKRPRPRRSPVSLPLSGPALEPISPLPTHHTSPSPRHDPASSWILLAVSIDADPDHQMCSNQNRISLSLIAAPPSALIPTPTAAHCDRRHNTHGLHTLR